MRITQATHPHILKAINAVLALPYQNYVRAENASGYELGPLDFSDCRDITETEDWSPHWDDKISLAESALAALLRNYGDAEFIQYAIMESEEANIEMEERHYELCHARDVIDAFFYDGI